MAGGNDGARHWSGRGVLPTGVLSLVCGSAEGLLDAVEPFGFIAFTGSAETGRIRAHPAVIAANPRIGIGADSVNAAPTRALGHAGRGGLRTLILEQALAADLDQGRPMLHQHPPHPGAGGRQDAFVATLAARIDTLVVGGPARRR